MFWFNWFSIGFKKLLVKDYINIYGKSVGGCVVFCLCKILILIMNSDNNILKGFFLVKF